MRSRQRLLESFCIVQVLVGTAHLAFVVWEDEPTYLTYSLIGIVGGFNVLAIIGFLFTKLRSKWGVLIFAIVEILMIIAFIVLVYGLSVSSTKCSSTKTIFENQELEGEDGVWNADCPSLYHKSDNVVGQIVILLDVLFMLVNAALGVRLFYIIYTGKKTEIQQQLQQEPVSDIFSEDEISSPM